MSVSVVKTTFWTLDCEDTPNPEGTGMTYRTFEEARDKAIASLTAGIDRLKKATAEDLNEFREIHWFIQISPVELTAEDYLDLHEWAD